MLPPVFVSGLTVNIELAIAVMSINELLEVRLEFCMCIIGDSDWEQRRLGGAHCTMEHTDFLPKLPVSPVMLFTGA